MIFDSRICNCSEVQRREKARVAAGFDGAGFVGGEEVRRGIACSAGIGSREMKKPDCVDTQSGFSIPRKLATRA